MIAATSQGFHGFGWWGLLLFLIPVLMMLHAHLSGGGGK